MAAAFAGWSASGPARAAGSRRGWSISVFALEIVEYVSRPASLTRSKCGAETVFFGRRVRGSKRTASNR